jgi:hypothetical protein
MKGMYVICRGCILDISDYNVAVAWGTVAGIWYTGQLGGKAKFPYKSIIINSIDKLQDCYQ